MGEEGSESISSAEEEGGSMKEAELESDIVCGYENKVARRVEALIVAGGGRIQRFDIYTVLEVQRPVAVGGWSVTR